jgi:flagellar biogenesis protein FliO
MACGLLLVAALIAWLAFNVVRFGRRQGARRRPYGTDRSK